MNVLAFDTCLGACSAAVLVGNDPPVLARAFERRARGHAEVLMDMIDGTMREAGLGYGDLDRVAVTVGPGSFTGVRIAVATARGLALATSAQTVGLTTLHVMARDALDRLDGIERLAVAVDARRETLYVQLFDGDATPLTPPALLSPRAALARLGGGRVQAVGSGARLLADAASASPSGLVLATGFPDLEPDAGILARMAADPACPTGIVRPHYLRPPDAKAPAPGP